MCNAPYVENKAFLYPKLHEHITLQQIHKIIYLYQHAITPLLQQTLTGIKKIVILLHAKLMTLSGS